MVSVLDASDSDLRNEGTKENQSKLAPLSDSPRFDSLLLSHIEQEGLPTSSRVVRELLSHRSSWSSKVRDRHNTLKCEPLLFDIGELILEYCQAIEIQAREQKRRVRGKEALLRTTRSVTRQALRSASVQSRKLHIALVKPRPSC